MNILITGSSGFIGSNLYANMHKDFNLLGLDITTKGVFPPSSIYSWEDLEQLPPVNTIIHLAGKAHDTKNTSDPQSYFDINTGLTKTIFDYFLESKAEKFIFFSSVKAIADSVNGEFLTEGVEPNPQTPYGQSKLEAERYILSKTLPKNKKVYILRPCMIHGPGNKGNLNLLYSIVKKGMPWPLGAFENKRSFLSIDNLAFILRQLIEKNIKSGIYQVSDDDPISTNKLFSLIATSLQRKPRIINTPKGLVNLLAKTGDILHLPINTERLNKLTENYIVSNEKIKKALEIDSLPTTAEDGIIKTINSFKNQEQ
ncbi:MAG TPA: nucleoside-diphosphate-sugar epimerase [Bacteroidales bacterium]|jgi:nucleoside-diphosphate-sugar epimerase|nr:nucleoside-diphosphate-sugar epimerase [Bacteroidales bacterium]